MLPRNLISASLVLTAFVLSFFTNDKSIAEEKRKLNLEKDKVYEHVIKPILSANCTTCHGSSKAKGKIRLHNPEEIKKSESIVEGNIDELAAHARSPPKFDVIVALPSKATVDFQPAAVISAIF